MSAAKATPIVEKSEEDEADDTATESYGGDSGEENSQYSYNHDDGRALPMPPLKYARIMGCLPRGKDPSTPFLSVKITSSAMGRVVVRPSQYMDKGNESSMPSGSRHGDGTKTSGGGNTEWKDYIDEEVDMSMTNVYHALALGLEDGKVRLVDALTGDSVLFGSTPGDGGAWFVNPSAAKRGHEPGHKIVSLSFDSSSSYLCALNANGDAAIFGPLIWGRQSRLVPSSASGEGQKFGFLSSFGGKDSEAANDRKVTLRPPFTLVKPPSSTVRFTYSDPQSFGSSLLGGGSSDTDHGYHPTCMALDPAYGRKKERALVVGFDDGRMILSKLQGAAGIGSGITSLFGGGGSNAAAGGTTVKKIDSVLYQGMGAASYSGDQAGIEAVTWRGGLVAWADSSGVRLFDIESMSRIAHIPRPTGARSSLYPTISSLRPLLLFERSDSLLFGWGDCLMAWRVQDSQSSMSATKDGTTAKEMRRKTVTSTMAFDLDCVACGVVPMDEKHVAVLGLVPSASSSLDAEESDHGNTNDPGDYSVAGGDNVLELQIINREDGTSISNDRLPLLEGPGNIQGDQRIITANAAEFCLQSSFAMPRMDDVAEWEALDDAEKEAVRGEMGNIGSQSASFQRLPDLHLRWNICSDVCSVGDEIQSEAANFDDQSVASDCSVCSDNYVFVLSEPIGDILPDSVGPTRSPPPIMTVLYSHDACLVQTRDIDDAVSYTRSLGKSALALKQALAHRRDVRRHGFDQLVDEYFLSLLRMSPSGKDRPLSFSRLKIASESLPILLGGDPRMWQRWIFMFSRIPGGLYVIREKIPVRDPSLPTFLFEMSLEKMIEEATSGLDGQEHVVLEGEDHQRQDNNHLGDKMAVLLLETMRSWGPTSALRRRIQLHRHHCAQDQRSGLQCHPQYAGSSLAQFVRQAEKDLHRRITQTSFGVLTDSENKSSSPTPNNSIRQYIDSSEDSLFDVDHLLARISTRLQLSDTIVNESLASSTVVLGHVEFSSVVIVEAMAELELMREQYDRALGYYLAIGSRFMSHSLPSLEEEAINSVNSHRQSGCGSSGHESKFASNKYGHVLSLIELHQLSHILLRRNFSFTTEKEDSDAETPIIALILLVGLSRAGRFLIDNCAPPEGTSDNEAASETRSPFNRPDLPIDVVADQMKSRPKILYWFLFQIFLHKADIYVKFPTTAAPGAEIQTLHRIHFSLFVDFANLDGATETNNGDSTRAALTDTPFMAFLRAALPLGGVQADSVREKLETCRSGGADSSVFARELAFVIEYFGNGSVEDAREILGFYLHGANSLYMAVAFAERSTQFSSILWDMLVEHCTTPDPTIAASEQNSALGARFGSLLEAAAHNGSDLASLISRIPEGMPIEGLRPKLIAAITDYHYKVKIHEQTDTIMLKDKISILRELSHRSWRGERVVPNSVKQCGKIVTEGPKPMSRLDTLRSLRLKVPSGNESPANLLPIR